MRQSLPLLAAAVLLTAVFAGPASATQADGTAALSVSSPPSAQVAAKKCVWRWKRKKVVKRVKRNGKVKKVVTYRKRRVCVPVKPAPPSPARIGVNAYEFHFILSTNRLKSGDTIAELNNRGEDPHDLHIARVDGTGTELSIPETLPSTYARLRFDTEPGTYRLWCSLPFHAERGMDTTFEAVPRP